MPTTTTPRRTAGRKTARPSIPRRRKPQPPSRGEQIFGLLTKAVPSAAAAKKAKPSGKGGKLALLGAAGGVAALLKNRDKLPFGGGKSTQPPGAPPETPAA